MSARLRRFLENRVQPIGPNGPNGTDADTEILTNTGRGRDKERNLRLYLSLYGDGDTSSDRSDSYQGRTGGQEELTVEHAWTDDRSWISDIRHAPDAAAKLAVLAAWVAAAGGKTVGRIVMLPGFHPHRAPLAALELRRMCRQFGLNVLEDET